MKKIFLLISLVLLFDISAGAVESNCLSSDKLSFDDTGVAYATKGVPYTGCMYSNYPNGNLNYEGTLKDGLLDGTYRQYYPEGQLEHESQMVKGINQGVSKLYWKNGTLKGENTYKDDKLNGKFTKYYEDGKLHVVGNYKDNKLDGEHIIYYPDGSIKKKGTFKDGKKIYQTRNIVIDQEVSIGGKYIPEKGENRPVSVESRQESKTITAIVVDSVPSEYEYLDQEYSGYRLIQQALIKSGTTHMDVLTIETADGEEKEIYFDISSFYGNYEKILSGEK